MEYSLGFWLDYFFCGNHVENPSLPPFQNPSNVLDLWLVGLGNCPWGCFLEGQMFFFFSLQVWPPGWIWGIQGFVYICNGRYPPSSLLMVLTTTAIIIIVIIIIIIFFIIFIIIIIIIIFFWILILININTIIIIIIITIIIIFTDHEH